VLFDQLRSLNIDYKEYRYTFNPETKVLVLVFFDDETLNKEAEELRLKI
jgi:hypothetical protein